MLHTLLGEKAFRAGSDCYFERHDGEAVTIDDFVSAMESASSKDLSQFKNWYTQAGTPTLEVKDDYNEVDQVYKITIETYRHFFVKKHRKCTLSGRLVL